jgi:hypothetical protein
MVPLLMRFYDDGENFEGDYWSFDDEEGVRQYFYHDKKSPNGYWYADTRNVKDNVDVPDGFTKNPNKGIMPQYYWTNAYRTNIYVPFKKFFKTRCNLDTDTCDPHALNGHNVHKHLRHALPPPGTKEGTSLWTHQKMTEIMYGAAESSIESGEESNIIEANLVEDEMNNCDFANKIHLCKHCREDPCVWIMNSSRVKEWEQRKLQDVPGFSTGFTALVMKEILLQNRKKFFRYATQLVWGYLCKNCRREHYGCVKIGGRSMCPDPNGKYMATGTNTHELLFSTVSHACA